MKKIGPELDRIITEKGVIKKNVAEKLGITPTYFSRLLKSDTMDCLMLDNICRIIGVSPAVFFDNNEPTVNIGGANATSVIGNASAIVNITQGEISALRELLAEKERTIQILLQKSGQNRDK
ncbi:MAG: hypothetical protein IKT03_05550 [Muribaculaceae bacterium]|nr:hypothetical protein [Muribaculaceae bacterium]MBR6489983.1 hypothetical protein [Muribaculaceae bacterium]